MIHTFICLWFLRHESLVTKYYLLKAEGRASLIGRSLMNIQSVDMKASECKIPRQKRTPKK